MNNFTNNRWLSVITLLLLIANMVTLALLWTDKTGHHKIMESPPPVGPAVEFITRELKLDSAQQAAFARLREDHRAGQDRIRDSISIVKDELFGLLKQVNVTDSAMLVYSNKIGQFEQQRDLATFKHFQKLRAICNKEQQNKFDNIIQEVLRRMAGPKGPPGPPPPGMENGDRVPPQQ